MMMNRTALFWIFVMLVLPGTALAAWGENWGEMVWGLPVSVPSLPAVGFFVLALALLSTAAWRLRARKALHSALAILLSLPLLLLTLSSVAEAQTVVVPNTVTNGSVADADALNDNFAALLQAVNAVLTTGPVSVPNTFTNGTTADADEVNANFTALETAVNAVLANRATDCATLGGTWDAGTSTCAPPPPPDSACMFCHLDIDQDHPF